VLKESGLLFEPALPVVWNLPVPKQHDDNLINSIPDILQFADLSETNQVASGGHGAFQEGIYDVIKMLSGFFWPL